MSIPHTFVKYRHFVRTMKRRSGCSWFKLCMAQG
jgi:hypothetical protein